ncbi:MAG: ABC transporter permease [Gammaproteobacteria bacterium]|nr:ABC transporter permease [Gammaproteobacteria bacterium]MBQ0840645.1 ABC transporter permease [Gammaproteobacteria bacterium]
MSFYLAVVSGLCLFFADLEIISPNPWLEFKAMGQGLINPKIVSYSELLAGLGNTLSFALQGMAVAALAGFMLALVYQHWWVRVFCAFIRAIHELFWALIFIQCFGLSPLTGLLAIALPYAGTLAKIYGELFEETSPQARANLLNSKSLSAFLYTTLPLAWPALSHYTRYRFECALRSTVVLGFVGLPTLGFYLETSLSEGHYAEAAGLLYVLLLLIASQRWWLRKTLLPVYLLLAVVYLPPSASFDWPTLVRFFTEDIIPLPLRAASGDGLVSWLAFMWQQQLWPGLSNTLVLSQIALFATALLALLFVPFNSRLFVGPFIKRGGDGLLIIARTLPEYLLAFVALLLWGPSMLPAIVALALHNSAIVAHLLARFSEQIVLRDDACKGVNRYFYEVLARSYRQFLAILFYRWEVIMRESAILGILGIATLGFYIDSAFEEFRFDRAALLILASALLNMAVDTLARCLRRGLHLNTTADIR